MADYSSPTGMEHRVVRDIEHNGQPARVVSGACDYEAEPADVWGAITHQAQIPKWFLPISGDFVVGGRYQLEGHAGGKVIRCEPLESLEITWECQGNISWVHVRLERLSQGTRMTLQHIMGKDEASEKHWAQFGPGATGVGWDLAFVGLGVHLVSGEQIDQAESLAWMGSEPGKDFIRACSQAWGESHVAAGEPAENAIAVATATAKFYCGENP